MIRKYVRTYFLIILFFDGCNKNVTKKKKVLYDEEKFGILRYIICR